jgi:NTE family protein
MHMSKPDRETGGRQAQSNLHAREPHKIAVALQGGGSHGGFTWGVLDRLLEETSLRIVGVSGTSAGAMNAGALADGLRRGGPNAARASLQKFWESIGRLPGITTVGGSLAAGRREKWHFDDNPMFLWFDMLSRIWSPYQTNPFDYNPLRGVLDNIDFEGLRNDENGIPIFICATNVRTGLRRVFVRSELTREVLLASACLPHMFQAVDIGGEHFWDGGYTGNPALGPLYLRTTATDVIVIGINPMIRDTLPNTARDIINRIDEISFNATFMMELGAIAFVEEVLAEATHTTRFRRLFIHGIGAGSQLSAMGASSKLNNSLAFLHHLHDLGRQAADSWIMENLDRVGISSTIDLTGLIPKNNDAITGPTALKRASHPRDGTETVAATIKPSN